MSTKRHCKLCGRAKWGTERLGKDLTIVFTAYICNHTTILNRNGSLKQEVK